MLRLAVPSTTAAAGSPRAIRPRCRGIGRWALLAAALLLSSCGSTYTEKIVPAQEAFYRGNLPTARAELRQVLDAEDPDDSDYPLFLLEKGMLELAAGDAEQAEKDWGAAKDRLEDIEAEQLAAFGGDVASYFTDDRFTVYDGEDYEKILVRFFLAVANALHDGGDVVAYANQVLIEQQEILDREVPVGGGRPLRKNYKKIGAGSYLYGLVTEERDPTATSEVRISYERVKDWEPQFSLIDADLERLAQGVHSRKGNGVVYVVAFVGKGPQKVEVEETDLAIATEIGMQLTRLIPIVRKQFGATLDLSPIKIADLRPRRDNPIRDIEVAVGGEARGATEILTDVTKTAVQQFNEIRAWVIGKAVARRMVKKAITTAAKGAARIAVEGDRTFDRGRRRARSAETHLALAGIELAGILANTLWSAAERADTRHWSFLPDTIQVLRLELPVGDHDIELTPRLGGSARGLTRSVPVEVRPGENTYVVAFIPVPGVGPAPLTSRPARGDLAAQ